MIRMVMVLISLVFGASVQASENIDLTFASKDPSSAEFLFASERGYAPQSAQAAYVAHTLIGAYLQYENDVTVGQNPAYFDRLMQDRFDEAVAKVKGASYRDGYLEGLLKFSVNQLGSGLQKGKVSFTPLADKLIEDGLDAMAKPSYVPLLQFDIVVGTNTYMLQRVAGPSLLDKYLRRTAALFHADLNLQQDLNVELSVLRQRMEQQNQITLRKLAVQQQRDAAVVNNALASVVLGLERQSTQLNELLAASQRSNERERSREETAKDRAELVGYFGIASAFAAVSGNREAALFIDQSARFAGAAFDAFNSGLNFSDNPAAYTNAYVAALQLGVSIFSSQQADPRWKSLFSALQKVMEQLQVIQKQLVVLGDYIERRFNALDQTLQSHVHESREYFRQVVSSSKREESGDRYLTEVLGQFQRQSYAGQLLSANLAWARLKYDCFPKGKSLDENTFRLCRDEIGLFAIAGSALRESVILSSNPEPFRAALYRLAPTLNLGEKIEQLPIASDPVVWLAATKSLVSLARQNPQHRGLFGEQELEPLSAFNLAKIIQTGRLYQRIVSEMALVTSPAGFKLRRSVINGIVSSYQTAVEGALDYTKDLPQKYLRGIPNPARPLKEQQPPSNPNLYPIMTNAILPCEEKVRITYATNIDPSGASLGSHIEFLNKSWLEKAEEIKLPPDFLAQLPHSLRFALTSAFADQDEADLKVFVCFRSIALYDRQNWATQQLQMTGTTDFKAEMEIRAEYTSRGTRKNLLIMRMKGQRIFATEEMALSGGSAGHSWLSHAWNGIQINFPGTPYPPAFVRGTGIKDRLMKVFSDVSFEGLPEFERDFQAVLQMVHRRVTDELQNHFQAFDAPTRLARDSLTFVLEGGLENTPSEVTELLRFVCHPQNLPDAKVWAETQYRRGVSKGVMERILGDKLAQLERLVDAVEKLTSLRPGTDVFGPRLRELAEYQ